MLSLYPPWLLEPVPNLGAKLSELLEFSDKLKLVPNKTLSEDLWVFCYLHRHGIILAIKEGELERRTAVASLG